MDKYVRLLVCAACLATVLPASLNGQRDATAADVLAFAGAPNRPVRLLASATVFPLPGDPVATLTPNDFTAIETLESPVVASVEVPRDAARSYFLVSVNRVYSWHQVASSAPYLFAGGFRIYVSSPALPAGCAYGIPGRIGWSVGFNPQIEESVPSAQDVDHLSDLPHSSLIDEQVLGRIIEVRCNQPPDAAGEMARQLISADSTWQMTARPRLRSVSQFILQSASLALFGN